MVVVDVLAECDFFIILVLTHVTLHWLAHERTPCTRPIPLRGWPGPSLCQERIPVESWLPHGDHSFLKRSTRLHGLRIRTAMNKVYRVLDGPVQCSWAPHLSDSGQPGPTKSWSWDLCCTWSIFHTVALTRQWRQEVVSDSWYSWLLIDQLGQLKESFNSYSREPNCNLVSDTAAITSMWGTAGLLAGMRVSICFLPSHPFVQ